MKVLSLLRIFVLPNSLSKSNDWYCSKLDESSWTHHKGRRRTKLHGNTTDCVPLVRSAAECGLPESFKAVARGEESYLKFAMSSRDRRTTSAGSRSKPISCLTDGVSDAVDRKSSEAALVRSHLRCIALEDEVRSLKVSEVKLPGQYVVWETSIQLTEELLHPQ